MVEIEKELYSELLKQKEEGKIFTKEELTYDILYKLVVIENISDREIGELFNLSKNQVIYQRKKHGIENVLLKKIITRPEIMLGYLEEHNIDKSLLNEDKYYNLLKYYAESKGWNTNLVDKYRIKIQEKITEEENLDIEVDYKIDFTDSIIEQNSNKKTTRQLNGKKTNQLKNNINKIKAGKLGEKIVLNEENKKIKDIINKKILAPDKKAISVTETEDKNITLDGLGYDVESYNENGEKIYIEVKCSTTTKNNNLNFEISDKEVDFINGKLAGIDKEHAFIYYVYNINKRHGTAKIEKIDYNKFKELTLVPVNYKVSGTLITKK